MIVLYYLLVVVLSIAIIPSFWRACLIAWNTLDNPAITFLKHVWPGLLELGVAVMLVLFRPKTIPYIWLPALMFAVLFATSLALFTPVPGSQRYWWRR